MPLRPPSHGWRVRQARLVEIGPKAQMDVWEEVGRHEGLETGGLLFGHRHEDGLYTVIEATRAPPDSLHERGCFQLGAEGVDESILDARRRGLSYVGEWHCHPSGDPRPSAEDGRALREVARGTDEPPVMLIVGYEWAWYVVAPGPDDALLRRLR